MAKSDGVHLPEPGTQLWKMYPNTWNPVPGFRNEVYSLKLFE